MFGDLIEEADKVDLEPKPASLWWTSTTRTCKAARKIWAQMRLPFLNEKLWKACSAPCNGCDEKTNAVLDSLKKMKNWRSTRWWQSPHARMMKEDPENRTKWKHKWVWHNRGNVWDKMAEYWECKKDWMTARKEQNSPEDRYKFITHILNKMKLLTEHRKKEMKDEEQRFEKFDFFTRVENLYLFLRAFPFQIAVEMMLVVCRCWMIGVRIFIFPSHAVSICYLSQQTPLSPPSISLSDRFSHPLLVHFFVLEKLMSRSSTDRR